MEYFWSLYNNSNGGSSSSTNNAWESFDQLATSRQPDWNSFNYPPPSLMVHNPDPHLTCLKLGKRHYFEDVTAAPTAAGSKKGKLDGNGMTSEQVVPRCQVDGCEAVLVKAKDYHRRHKVCEMHAKAPKVVLLGIDQRFCQQCSRFHALREFDEAKRSCRRRLAGHNERRRKTSHEQNSLARKHSQGGQPDFLNNGECALSLLSSSSHYTTLSTSPDLPARCSAALRELIAEKRASISAWRHAHQIEGYKLGWSPVQDHSEGHVTLNLMQAPASGFGLLSEDDDERDCSELWKVPLGY